MNIINLWLAPYIGVYYTCSQNKVCLCCSCYMMSWSDDRLGDDCEMVRLDALRKLHCLELMTPQLLPVFLTSLSDQHVSIRTEAIAVH